MGDDPYQTLRPRGLLVCRPTVLPLVPLGTLERGESQCSEGVPRSGLHIFVCGLLQKAHIGHSAMVLTGFRTQG